MWYIQNVSPYNEHIVPPIDDSMTIPFHGKTAWSDHAASNANKILQGGTPPTYVGVTMDISWYIHM